MRFSAFLLLLSLIVQPLCRAADCLRIGALGEASEINLDRALTQTIYREAGLCATVVRVPTERLKRMLETGDLDGVAARSKEFNASQPNLVMVPTPVSTVDIRLYWPAGASRPGKGSRVGLPRGWVGPRAEAQAMGAEPVEIADNTLLPKMAEAGRIDGFVLSDLEFDNIASNVAGSGRFESASIKEVPLYHAVTSAHAELIPLLDAAIQRLASRGDIERLLDHHRGM